VDATMRPPDADECGLLFHYSTIPFKSHPAPEDADRRVLLLQDEKTKNIFEYVLPLYTRCIQGLIDLQCQSPPLTAVQSAYYCAHVFTKISLILH
jgi:hypothetical protein